MSLDKVLQQARQRRTILTERLQSDLSQYKRCVLEIGCGHGHWLSGYAATHSDDCCIGIDLSTQRIKKTLRKKKNQSLGNLWAYKAEANEFLDCLPPDINCEYTFIIYPDPWPKQRHHRRRLMQRDFLSRLARHTAPGGQLYLRTDQQTYIEWSHQCIKAHQDWRLENTLPWPYEQETFFQKILPQHISLAAVRM